MSSSGTSLKRGTWYSPKLGVQHPAVLESHLLAQRRAEAHDDRAFDLGAQIVRVDDRAALEDFANVPHA